jgi:hypothetical protein
MRQVLIWGAGVAGVLTAAAAGVLLVASRRPPEFRVERSILTEASAEDVYHVLSDLSRFPEWSPWHRLDPHMTTELTGDQGHLGASYSWSGNSKVGAGSMTIIETVPSSHVSLKLEFLRPFVATNHCTWRISEEQGQRRVSWSMEGRMDGLFKRACAMLAGMDQSLLDDFDRGLQALKALLEAKPSRCC